MMKKWLNHFDDYLSMTALIGVITITVVNVFCRFVLQSPIAWAEEVTLSLFIWLVFIGVSSALKRNKHLGIDYFVRKMPRSLFYISRVIRTFVIYFVLIWIFVYFGYGLMEQASSKLTPVLQISYQWIDLAVPLGGVLAAIHFTIRLRRDFIFPHTEKEGDV